MQLLLLLLLLAPRLISIGALLPANQKESTFIGIINKKRLRKPSPKQVFKSNSYCYYILTLFYQSLQTLPLPSAELMHYIRDI